MKIYEKPSVDIKRFDVEDIMSASGVFDANNTAFEDIAGEALSGVVFEW